MIRFDKWMYCHLNPAHNTEKKEFSSKIKPLCYGINIECLSPRGAFQEFVWGKNCILTETRSMTDRNCWKIRPQSWKKGPKCDNWAALSLQFDSNGVQLRSLRLGTSPDRGHNLPSTLQVALAKRPDTNNFPPPPSLASLDSMRRQNWIQTQKSCFVIVETLSPQAAEHRPNLTNMRVGNKQPWCGIYWTLPLVINTPVLL